MTLSTGNERGDGKVLTQATYDEDDGEMSGMVRRGKQLKEMSTSWAVVRFILLLLLAPFFRY